MTLFVVVLTWCSVWAWTGSRVPAARLNAIRVSVRLGQERKGIHGRRVLRETVSASAAGGLAFVMVGGPAGVPAAVIAFVIVFCVMRGRQPVAARREATRMIADLPFAADLMVACLRAGQPLSGALEVTATTIGGPVGKRLHRVSAQLRLGADPAEAWSPLARERALAQLSTTMIRAAATGAPVADALTRLADDAADTARAASSAAARRVGVQAVAPLGLCFLPAFVLLGIVPVVAGLATQVLLP
ncbi:type II secretion system F family protein [Streptosporangium soli]|nr:type II secretion system F family protein [Streptosporangium sp. KLBMP 9127]